MTEFKDDPRDVLALLNSLGFVGITAPQLKAFMKDLKMRQKIKEREKQQWKEDTKKKILNKQEYILQDLLTDTITARQSGLSENIPSNNSSQQGNPLVRIKVHCISEDEEKEDRENETTLYKEDNRVAVSSLRTQVTSTRQHKEGSKNRAQLKLTEDSACGSQFVTTRTRNIGPRTVPREELQENYEARVPVRTQSAPDFSNEAIIPKGRSKSVVSEPTASSTTRNNPSRCSTHSQAKSFIRPWRLRPEIHRASSATKSDPVALYQKYQQEWKQISFPGEEQHARVRWAIREKMLGTNPNPRVIFKHTESTMCRDPKWIYMEGQPILKKSESLMSIKKR